MKKVADWFLSDTVSYTIAVVLMFDALVVRMMGLEIYNLKTGEFGMFFLQSEDFGRYVHFFYSLSLSLVIGFITITKTKND